MNVEDQADRFSYPALELVSIYGPAGLPERFVNAGGKLVQGRMIAMRDDPVWTGLQSQHCCGGE